MTILQTIILGIIQGITEFLPISSSGHLVLAPHLFGWEIAPQDAFAFDVLVQVATLLAVFAYFWDDIQHIARAVFNGLWKKEPFGDPQARMGWYLVLATIPAGAAYLLFSDTFERAFGSPLATASFLLVTAALLLIAEKIGKRNRGFEKITWVDALIVGAFQILAIFPGVSRSGATIAGGMTRNLQRPAAARFSFLISIPIMLAGGVIGVLKLIEIPNYTSLLNAYFAGFVTAAIVGYIAIRWLLHYLSQRPLYIFAIYCLIFGLLNLALILL